MKRYITLLLAFLTWAIIPVGASVLGPLPTFIRFTDDSVPTAAQYNQDVGFLTNALQSWINTNLVAALNVLTTKGDMYIYGPLNAIARLPVGSNGQVLTSNSAATNGVNWAAATGQTAATTKGDLTTTQGDGLLARLPVGSNGSILTADATALTGLSWKSQSVSAFFPVGTIVAWSPGYAGTTTIPSGFYLCDGTNGTPNLIGMFIIGTRPGGSGATPSAGGYGAEPVDAFGSGTKASHSHTIASQGPIDTSQVIHGTFTYNTSINNILVLLNSHIHNATIPAQTTNSSTSTEPSNYALCYLIANGQ